MNNYYEIFFWGMHSGRTELRKITGNCISITKILNQIFRKI